MSAALKHQIEEKKAKLDALRPLHAEALDYLRRHYDIELTYTSNAIEGNTLSAAETELVVEKGITVAGKPLRDHLEALDHFEALGFVHALAAQGQPITEFTVRQLHELVVRRSHPEIAGQYATVARLVRTDDGRHDFPPPAEVPALMGAFGQWLQAAPATPDAAFEAHKRLVGVHPFNDGNGRTARLLMNLVLIRSGYPPIAVRPVDRLDYIRGLAAAQAGQDEGAFEALLYRRLDETLGEYLDALDQALRPKS
jgi:Fic family protein